MGYVVFAEVESCRVWSCGGKLETSALSTEAAELVEGNLASFEQEVAAQEGQYTESDGRGHRGRSP